MTPKEKAKDLVDKFRNVEWIEEDKEIIRYKWIQCNEAKQCALIAVDELIADEHLEAGDSPYWIEVKQEIKAL